MRHDCEATREGLTDLLFGEAEGGARAAPPEEVALCEACAREYRTMSETLRAFDAGAEATLPAEDFWPGYGERLRMRIEQEIKPNFWASAAGLAGEYRLTFVEDEGLTRRLARELKAVARDAELSWPEFRRDPAGFASRSVTAYGRALARFFSQRDVALASMTAVLAVSILVASVFALERFRATHGLLSENPYKDLALVGYVAEIPREQPPAGEGPAGTNVGDGGGSKLKKEKPGGGGGGGREEALPVSKGKPAPASMQEQILPPSAHPPAVKAPLLPVQQTVKGDPLLMPDIAAKVPYGDPNSTNMTPSDGSGKGGGQGTGNGTGQGSGDGKGRGPGEGENTGGNGTHYGGGGAGGGGGGGTGGGPNYSRTFRSDEVTARAVITFKPEPGFTEEARRENVTGTVRLRAVLSASGQVTSISVVKGLPGGLTEKAIEAAGRIKFRPAQKDGRNVSQYVTLEYGFNIY